MTLRGPGGATAAAYPPSAGYIALVAGTTSRSASSGSDTTGAGSPF